MTNGALDAELVPRNPGPKPRHLFCPPVASQEQSNSLASRKHRVLGKQEEISDAQAHVMLQWHKPLHLSCVIIMLQSSPVRQVKQYIKIIPSVRKQSHIFGKIQCCHLKTACGNGVRKIWWLKGGEVGCKLGGTLLLRLQFAQEDVGASVSAHTEQRPGV